MNTQLDTTNRTVRSAAERRIAITKAIEQDLLAKAKAQAVTQGGRGSLELRTARAYREMMQNDPSLYSTYLASKSIASGGTRELQGMQEAG